MDEMRMVRDLYADPRAATAVETRDARARLDALTTPPRRWRRARWAVPGLGLAAAATAVALVASQSGDPSPRTTPSASPMTAGQVLLAAAESSAHAPLKSGAYWFTREQSGDTIRVTGRHGPYLVERRQESTTWIDAHVPNKTAAESKAEANAAADAGRDLNTFLYRGERRLGVRPMGPANIAAWKKDGSPGKWVLSFPGHPPQTKPYHETINSEPGPWAVHKVPAIYLSSFDDGSLQQVRALPTDPAKLRAYFLSRGKLGQGTRQDWQTPDQWVFTAAVNLLTTEPAPPAVRVAAYRMLAALPGVHSAGAVTDPLGRPGVAVEMATEPGHNGRLVIEPSSGRLLASETISAKDGEFARGTLEYWHAPMEASWANTPPRDAKLDPQG